MAIVSPSGTLRKFLVERPPIFIIDADDCDLWFRRIDPVAEYPTLGLNIPIHVAVTVEVIGD